MASCVLGLWPNHQLDPGRDSRACVQRHPGSWTGSDLLSQWWSIWNQIAKTLLFVILQPQVVLGLHIVRGDNICVVSGAPQRKRAWDAVSDVMHNWVPQRPDFKSALRVVKIVLNTQCCQYLCLSMWFHAKKSKETLKNSKSLILQCKFSSRAQKWPKIAK